MEFKVQPLPWTGLLFSMSFSVFYMFVREKKVNREKIRNPAGSKNLRGKTA